MELVYLAGALAGGTLLAGSLVWVARRAMRRPPVATTRKAKAREAPVPLEVIDFDPAPAAIAPPRASAAGSARASAGARSPARPVLAPPPPGIVPPRGHPAHAPAMVLTRGVELQDATAARAPQRAPPPARPPMRAPPPAKSWAAQAMEQSGPEIPSEWARRQVGPVEPGRVAGACGGCGARLSVSTQRPLRIACPVCGRTKLLAS